MGYKRISKKAYWASRKDAYTWARSQGFSHKKAFKFGARYAGKGNRRQS